MGEAEPSYEDKIDFPEDERSKVNHQHVEENVPQWGRKFKDKLGLPTDRCACTIGIFTLIIVISNVFFALLVLVPVLTILSGIVASNQRIENAIAKTQEQIQELHSMINATQSATMLACQSSTSANYSKKENYTDFILSWQNESSFFHQLQVLVHLIEHAENTSSYHHSYLAEVLLDFKEETMTDISNVKAIVAENTNQVKNLSKHVDQLLQSGDEHASQLSLIAANLSYIAGHLAQVSNHLALFNSSQQSYTRQIQSLQSVISGLQSQLTNFNGILSGLREDIRSKISDLDEDVQQLQKDSSAASTDREDIKEGINDLKLLHSSSVLVRPSVIIALLTVIIQYLS